MAVRRGFEIKDDAFGATTSAERECLEDYAFEVVVVKYPELFTRECIQRSEERIRQWGKS
jgi:hypothetical protein